jgi:outer membrane protein TolC
VGAAVRTYEAQTVALAAARHAREQAEAEFKATQLGYRSGATSGLDIETARATYVQALVSEINALYAQAQAQATLQLLEGSNHA